MKIFSILLSILTLHTAHAFANSSDFDWNRYFLRTDIGFASKVRREDGKTERFIPGPMMEYGLERGFTFKKNFYFGADLTWNIFYPDSFREESLDIYKFWLIPISHLHFGYIFEDKSLVTVGLTYLWGFIGTYRRPYTEKTFFEVKIVRWFDDKWDDDAPFHQAIHEYFFTVGVGYRL